MPFKIITTVVHVGASDTGEELIVHTTGGTRIFTVSRGRGGKNFRIRTKDWPKPVERAVDEFVTELRRRGKAVDRHNVSVWVNATRGLVVGERIYTFLECGETLYGSTISLRGIITGFTIP